MQNLASAPQQMVLVPLDYMESRLSDLFDQKVNTIISAIHPEQKQDELLTRKEAAKVLGVSLHTLNEWTKAGRVQGYRIASRVRYKRAELESSLKQIKSVKAVA
jgi:excisionase family DNA binding protein